MRLKQKTNALASASFSYVSFSSTSSNSSTTPVFRKDPTQNSLSFQDPKTSISYRWLSNRPINSLNYERYDFQRNAFFSRNSSGDTLIADWTWWDGHISTPELCLSMSNPHV
ncbi:hypothetical protein J1614_010266 [Plenodomus biglobosus]|nr:hypothetical protein J1614_010266 [Plenodomus biglobosus]